MFSHLFLSHLSFRERRAKGIVVDPLDFDLAKFTIFFLLDSPLRYLRRSSAA